VPNFQLKKNIFRCLAANAYFYIFHDFLFVHAIEKIPEGKEVTISYVAPTLAPMNRSKAMERYGFECDCTLCLFEKKETASNKRKMALYTNLKSSEQSTFADLKDRIAKICALEPTAAGVDHKIKIFAANLFYNLVAKLGFQYAQVR